jgi:hypothetical protein
MLLWHLEGMRMAWPGDRRRVWWQCKWVGNGMVWLEPSFMIEDECGGSVNGLAMAWSGDGRRVWWQCKRKGNGILCYSSSSMI